MFKVICLIGILFLVVGCGRKKQEDQDRYYSIRAQKKIVVPSLPKVSELMLVGRYEEKDAKVFSVYTPDLNWDEMLVYARNIAFARKGRTVVYFFNDINFTPEKLPQGYFDRKYYDNCVAAYYFGLGGYESFSKFPLRDKI